MVMTRPWFRGALHTDFARRRGVVMAAAVPTVTAMPAVAEHMHRDHPGGEQHPNPVL